MGTEDLLIQKLDTLIGEMKRVGDLLEKNQSEWIDPDDACLILGIQRHKSNSHRRKLQLARERGFLTKFRDGKPIMYNRAEVHQLSIRIREGKVAI